MDKDLMEQILPIVEKTKEGILAAVSALEQEAPLLVKELLWWYGIKSFLFWILGICLMVATAWFLKKMWKFIVKEDDEEGYILGVFATLLFCIPGVAFFVSNFDWLKILVAPRLFLIEFVSNLLT